MKKIILLIMFAAGIAAFTSCAKHELAEIRLTDEKALELSNAVMVSMRTASKEGISKISPDLNTYEGEGFTLKRYSPTRYRISFDDFTASINGKIILIKEGSSDLAFNDVSAFTGTFRFGELEVVYGGLERDFDWYFSWDGQQYKGTIEIEDHSYSCVQKLFPLKTVM